MLPDLFQSHLVIIISTNKDIGNTPGGTAAIGVQHRHLVAHLLRGLHEHAPELPAAEQCCGFGGTFSVKNPDVSVAMGNDKARHVVETGAEYVVAGDNSCLAHIGGLLHRGRTGVKTIHLAEVLASTEQDPA